MLIHLALQDGFDGDEVAVSIDDHEAYRAEGVTTRTQISHAADMQLEVPDRPFVLGVDVTTREVRESFAGDSSLRLQSCIYPRLASRETVRPPKWGQLGSCIESEHDLVRLFIAPMGELAPFAHDEETALRQHTDRRGVVARGVSVKRTGCLQLQELL